MAEDCAQRRLAAILATILAGDVVGQRTGCRKTWIGTLDYLNGIDMDIREDNGDENAIRALIGAHFEGLKWTPTTQADQATFAADFLPEASLFPAARPVEVRTMDAFIDRMNSVTQGSLRTFEEHTLGMQVLVFGNVAVVLAASEMLENETEVNHDVSGYLLVKDEGEWRIAAHAWDQASEQLPVPEHLRQPPDSQPSS